MPEPHSDCMFFDGGRWSLYNEEDGLLACDITEIDFSGWKVVGGQLPDWGIYEIFEDVVTPKAWSEGLTVAALASNGQQTVLGTPDDGIYIAEGHAIDHVNPTPSNIHTACHGSQSVTLSFSKRKSRSRRTAFLIMVELNGSIPFLEPKSNYPNHEKFYFANRRF